MGKLIRRGWIFVVLFSAGAAAQSFDERIARELAGSKVQEHLFYLTDEIGPRVVGSPALEAARGWLESRLNEYGLKAIRREENPPLQIGPGVEWKPRGWSSPRLVVQQVSPWPATLIGAPLLYSTGTKGAQAGEVIAAPLPAAEQSVVRAFVDRYRGKLKGKFLLTGSEERRIAREAGPMYHVYSDAEMREFGAAAASAPKPPAPPAPTPGAQANVPRAPSFAETLASYTELYRFLRDEGVLGIVGPARGEGGTLFLRPSPSPPILPVEPPPMIDLAAEHFNRIVRLLQRGVTVRIEVDLVTEFHEQRSENLLADIIGTDKSGELVIAGAHLDSWHGGTGATDNGANVAVLLETARILAGWPTRPRRTIRFAFWDGEELGLAGSRGYVGSHLVDPQSGEKKREFEATSCYFNLDYGAGRIRGVYLQGRAELQPILGAWFTGIGGERLTATLRSTLGSDQASFERAGVPGISFIQDPLNYERRTHHTTMDLPDYVSGEDLNHNVRVLANVLMEAANAEERMPRRKGE